MADNLAKRIIPCLDIKDGHVVKGVNFVGLQNIGDPIEFAKFYDNAGADELVILDITASFEHRQIIINIVRAIAKEVHIPLTVGGGICTLEDMYILLDAGADKISLNSAAINNLDLIAHGAIRFGSQCIVIAIDVSSSQNDKAKKEVYIKGGRENTGLEMCSWEKRCQENGAGEFLLTSMDTDGTKSGYDIVALESLRQAVTLLIIASGGAGEKDDIAVIFEKNIADAALAASIFHNNEISIKQIKEYLKERNIAVRI